VREDGLTPPKPSSRRVRGGRRRL